MMYLVLGAILLFAAAWAASDFVYSRSKISNLKRLHENDLKTMVKMNQRYEAMKEARDHYKSECNALDKENKALKEKFN